MYKRMRQGDQYKRADTNKHTYVHTDTDSRLHPVWFVQDIR